MQVFHINDRTRRSGGWPRARHVFPALNQIGTRCDVCGRGWLYPGRYPEHPLWTEVEGGVEYPDALGTADPLLVVSEAVIGDWEDHGITGYEKFPLTITRATGRLRDVVPPQYFHIKVTGRCELNLEAMGVEIHDLCPKCGSRDFTVDPVVSGAEKDDPFESFPYLFREETLDGSDLFISDLFPNTHFCTQQVLDLVGECQRTNFRFLHPEEMRQSSPKEIFHIRRVRLSGRAPSPAIKQESNLTLDFEGEQRVEQKWRR